MPEMTLKIELSEDAKNLLQHLSGVKAENNDAGEVWYLRNWKGIQPFPMPEQPCAGRNVAPVGEGKAFPGNGKAHEEKDRLVDCVDCQVFAREFNRRYPGIDEGYLLGWFATAIENGKSAGRREAAAKESKSSNHAAYTAGYHASAPTNSDGKTSSPPGFKFANLPSPRNNNFRNGDYVWNWKLGIAAIYHREVTYGVFAIDGEYIAESIADLVPISSSCFDRFKQLSAESKDLREALGLLTTLAPKMVIDPDHPMKMAQEIVKVVSEERKQLESAQQTIEAEIPEEFRGPRLKDSVRLLAGAFRGLQSLFERKPTSDDTTSVPSPGPTSKS